MSQLSLVHTGNKIDSTRSIFVASVYKALTLRSRSLVSRTTLVRDPPTTALTKRKHCRPLTSVHWPEVGHVNLSRSRHRSGAFRFWVESAPCRCVIFRLQYCFHCNYWPPGGGCAIRMLFLVLRYEIIDDLQVDYRVYRRLSAHDLGRAKKNHKTTTRIKHLWAISSVDS